MQETVVGDARIALQYWGAWWRWQEQRGLGYAATGPGHQLMQMAKLGCRIQNGIRHDRSENIVVPRHVALVDAVVENLPQAQRAALVTYYIRNPRVPRRKVRSRALLRAELCVGRSI